MKPFGLGDDSGGDYVGDVGDVASQMGINSADISSSVQGYASGYAQQFVAGGEQYANDLAGQLGIDPSAIVKSIPPSVITATTNLAQTVAQNNTSFQSEVAQQQKIVDQGFTWTEIVFSAIGGGLVATALGIVKNAIGDAGPGPGCCATGSCDPSTWSWAYRFGNYSPADARSFEDFAYTSIQLGWESYQSCDAIAAKTPYAGTAWIDPVLLATAIRVWNQTHNNSTQRWVSRVVNGGVPGGFSFGVPASPDPISEAIQSMLGIASLAAGSSSTIFPVPTTVGFWVNDGALQPLAGISFTHPGNMANTGYNNFPIAPTAAPTSKAVGTATVAGGLIAAGGLAAYAQSYVTGTAITAVLNNAWDSLVGVFSGAAESIGVADSWAAEENPRKYRSRPSKAKYERCVRKVKKSGSGKNPWAICTASLGGRPKGR